jgi:outer membrane protein assembly factor BamE (lipoprotein component of BamABCDE complex)
MATNLDYVYRLKDQYSRKLATITKKQVAFTEQYKKSMGKVNATAVAHQRILKKNNQYYKNSKHTIDRVSKSLERMTMHQKS